eukprot:6100792-Ditylum_brightwellii.AAC.1
MEGVGETYQALLHLMPDVITSKAIAAINNDLAQSSLWTILIHVPLIDSSYQHEVYLMTPMHSFSRAVKSCTSREDDRDDSVDAIDAGDAGDAGDDVDDVDA